VSGWIRLHRGWRDCEAFEDNGEPFSDQFAWLWLIESAAWKDCTRRTAKGERVKVERGQFHTSLRNLGKAWRWGKWKVQNYLKRLEEHDMIRTAYGQSGVLITLCNYAKYQDVPDSKKADDRTATGQLPDTQEQGKQDSSPNGEGVPPVDTVKALWELGVTLLTASGHDERASRSIVGRWRKDYGDAETLVALTECQARRIMNPVEWVPRRLGQPKPGSQLQALIDQSPRYRRKEAA
jgi:hypothetical protein